jgi:hypothetical protein
MPRSTLEVAFARTILRRLTAGLAALALGVTGALVPTPTYALAATVGPSGSAFYTPPSPLPTGANGDVVWYRKTTGSTLTGALALAGANVWQIMYLSTNALGGQDAVTGTVLIPKGRPTTSMPIIGFAPGTQGAGDSCAPSKQIAGGLEYELAAIDALLAKGWAVAVTDYEGLGTPGQHTYMVGRSQGQALLDVVRAARRLGPAGLSSSTPLGLWGYSQGGGAAGWALQLQPTYAPELKFSGAALGGTPADLKVVASNLDGSAGFAFLGMAALGFDQAYPELNLKGYLNSAGVTALDKLDAMCVIEALAAYSFRHISDYMKPNPLSTAAWQSRLAESKLGATAPTVPVFLGHGTVDEFIPYSQALQLKKDWCAAGATVTWRTWVGGHVTAYLPFQPAAVSYLASRFSGAVPASSC